MAVGAAAIPNTSLVYRGLRGASWKSGQQITPYAFMLRPATELYPEPEAEISLGLTAAAAIAGITSKGVASLRVAAILALPHELQVTANPEDAQMADLIGLPLHSEIPEQRALAIAMATDLASISTLLP